MYPLKNPVFFCLLLLNISTVSVACAQQPKVMPPAQKPASPSTPLPPPGPPTPPKAKQNPSAAAAGVLYERLLQQAKAGDPQVDFGRLRMTYAESDKFMSYDINKDERAKAIRALAEANFQESLRLAESVLSKNFLDINAHFAALLAATSLKDESKQRFHAYAARGLVQSILASGDGKGADTAFHVISDDEMSAMMEVLNLKPVSQNLIKHRNQAVNVLRATNRDTGERTTLYFNIERTFK